MTIKSRAVLLSEKAEPLEIKDIEVQSPKAGEVLVKMETSGLCKSDLNAIEGHTRWNMPLVMGHEGLGTVVEVGSGVTNVKDGDRVILSWGAWCGDCFFCNKGEKELCDTIARPRGSGLMLDETTRFSMDGEVVYHFAGISSLSEYTVVHWTSCVKAGDELDGDLAGAIGCSVVTGMGAVFNTADIEEGATILVIGCGSIGMSVVQAARIRKASLIILVEPDKEKWEGAYKGGATECFEVLEPEKVQSMTGGFGVDYVFDTVALEETINASLSSVRRGGMVVMVGSPHPLARMQFSPIEFHLEKKLVGSLYGSADPQEDIPKILELIRSGELRLDNYVNGAFTLDEIDKAMAELKEHGGKYVIRF
jgi:S-(hydroxymethyl)glutathione dehydrogenase/alcohol dehydrogenase